VRGLGQGRNPRNGCGERSLTRYASSSSEVLPLLRRRWWHEVALWFTEQRTLVCADAVGTAQYYRAPGERLGVSPLLRLTPPRRLLAVEPDHVLVGHGEGIHDAAAALREAVTARPSPHPLLCLGRPSHTPSLPQAGPLAVLSRGRRHGRASTEAPRSLRERWPKINRQEAVYCDNQRAPLHRGGCTSAAVGLPNSRRRFANRNANSP
jgi:hypothetical protein